METKTIKVCDAIFIDISCDENYSTVTGYEFYVSPDEKEGDLRKFIDETMKRFKRKYVALSFSVKKDYPVKHLWTRERMAKCIEENEF